MDNHRATRRPDGKPETPADTRFFDLRESGYTGPIDQDGYQVRAGAAGTDDWVSDTRTGLTYSTYSAHPGLIQSPGEEWPKWRQDMRGRYAASRMRCPGCGELATRRLPTDLMPWQAHGRQRPAWSHADGSSLCPVIGPGGYEPATPVPASDDGGTAPSPAGQPAGLDLPASDAEFLDACAQLADDLGGLAAAVAGWAADLATLHLPQSVRGPIEAAATAITGAAAQVGQAADAFGETFSDARQAAAGGLLITGEDPA